MKQDKVEKIGNNIQKVTIPQILLGHIFCL